MKQSEQCIDLTIDYHAHILPCCDHGSDGIETSLRQIAMAAKAGVETICATPHFYPHREAAEAFLARRGRSYELLKPRLAAGPRIKLGAEVLICEGMEDMDGIRDLCLEGTNELLLELPFYKWDRQIYATILRLNERGDIRVVIAHADRYPAQDVEKLIENGSALQLNAESLLRPLSRRRYMSWIENGFVSYIGSDMHMSGRGYRDFARCVRLLEKRLRK